MQKSRRYSIAGDMATASQDSDPWNHSQEYLFLRYIGYYAAQYHTYMVCGGVAFLWKKSLCESVAVLTCTSDCIAAIKISVANHSALISSMYMATEFRDYLLVFSECVNEIIEIVENSNVEPVFLLGNLMLTQEKYLA